jgi:hypothetical protein
MTLAWSQDNRHCTLLGLASSQAGRRRTSLPRWKAGGRPSRVTSAILSIIRSRTCLIVMDPRVLSGAPRLPENYHPRLPRDEVVPFPSTTRRCLPDKRLPARLMTSRTITCFGPQPRIQTYSNSRSITNSPSCLRRLPTPRKKPKCQTRERAPLRLSPQAWSSGRYLSLDLALTSKTHSNRPHLAAWRLADGNLLFPSSSKTMSWRRLVCMAARTAICLAELPHQIRQEGQEITRTVGKNRMRLPGYIARALILQDFTIGIRRRHRSCHSMPPAQSNPIRYLIPTMAYLILATTISRWLRSGVT